MGSVRLPNLSNYGIYCYYKNLLNYNFNFWYYYYYYFHLKAIVYDIWSNKNFLVNNNSSKKISFKLKNCFVIGDTHLILSSNFLILKFSIFSYYNLNYFLNQNLNLNFNVLNLKFKNLKKLNYKLNF